jgi:hypothetical protein
MNIKHIIKLSLALFFSVFSIKVYGSSTASSEFLEESVDFAQSSSSRPLDNSLKSTKKPSRITSYNFSPSEEEAPLYLPETVEEAQDFIYEHIIDTHFSNIPEAIICTLEDLIRGTVKKHSQKQVKALKRKVEQFEQSADEFEFKAEECKLNAEELKCRARELRREAKNAKKRKKRRRTKAEAKDLKYEAKYLKVKMKRLLGTANSLTDRANHLMELAECLEEDPESTFLPFDFKRIPAMDISLCFADTDQTIREIIFYAIQDSHLPVKEIWKKVSPLHKCFRYSISSALLPKTTFMDIKAFEEVYKDLIGWHLESAPFPQGIFNSLFDFSQIDNPQMALFEAEALLKNISNVYSSIRQTTTSTMLSEIKWMPISGEVDMVPLTEYLRKHTGIKFNIFSSPAKIRHAISAYIDHLTTVQETVIKLLQSVFLHNTLHIDDESLGDFCEFCEIDIDQFDEATPIALLYNLLYDFRKKKLTSYLKYCGNKNLPEGISIHSPTINRNTKTFKYRGGYRKEAYLELLERLEDAFQGGKIKKISKTISKLQERYTREPRRPRSFKPDPETREKAEQAFQALETLGKQIEESDKETVERAFETFRLIQDSKQNLRYLPLKEDIELFSALEKLYIMRLNFGEIEKVLSPLHDSADDRAEVHYFAE